MIILLIFHFIRLLLLYKEKDQYITFMMVLLILQITLEILCYSKQTHFQQLLQYSIILVDFIVFQIESIIYGFNEVHQNFVFIIIIYVYGDLHNEKTQKVQWQIVKYGLLLLLFFGFSFEGEFQKKNTKLNLEYLSLINYKIHILLMIFLLSQNQKNNKQSQIQKIGTIQVEKCQFTNDQNENQIKRCFTQKSSSSHVSEMMEDFQTVSKSILNQNIDFNLILEALQEGVILVHFEKSDDLNQPNLKVEYQNQLSKKMFQKTNKELLQLFEKMPSEVLQDESPMLARSSLVLLQSFASQQYKNIPKRTSVLNAVYSISQDSKKDSKQNRISTQSPGAGSFSYQLNTVLRCILYVFTTKKLKFEINGKVEAMIIETSFEIDNNKKQIELIITFGGENILLIIARDVVHRKNIKELLDINQSKSKTLSFVSHEFRSPLNVMLNILSELKESSFQNKHIFKSVQIVKENAAYMLNLANDLLDLAQIKAETFNLNLKSFNLLELGEECLEMFKLQAEQKKIDLKIQTNTRPLFLYSDRNRLKQIFINLIANAMKFTQFGLIIIKFEQKGLLVNVGVKDSGIGISEDGQKMLFKAFGKIKDAQNQKLNEQGVGLGLLISNKIAQQLSYNNQGLQVISNNNDEKNHGSFFYLTLNIQDFHIKVTSNKIEQLSNSIDFPISYDQNPIKENFEYNDSIFQQKVLDIMPKSICQHILIVDDNVFNQNILEMQISQFTKSTIDKSFNGLEAIKCVNSKKCNEQCPGYQAIFMDLEMPVMNGMIASEQILKIKPNIKIFIVSGYDDNKLKQEGEKLGIKCFIIKPILKDKVQKLIQEYHL
ncbi:unnamed protein product [Paramecium primaurelia]|uniref:Uncharacterized protein n=1 Tax=Paramecium primaurelia TaxID=5886 RepID=A0A8S1M9G4_PARPR|nr:unnamed protein product [Paramecium primaurelia]